MQDTCAHSVRHMMLMTQYNVHDCCRKLFHTIPNDFDDTIVLQEHMLRAVRFLPDILRLQQLLTRRFNNSIDGAEAVALSAHELLQKLTDGML